MRRIKRWLKKDGSIEILVGALLAFIVSIQIAIVTFNLIQDTFFNTFWKIMVPVFVGSIVGWIVGLILILIFMGLHHLFLGVKNFFVDLIDFFHTK